MGSEMCIRDRFDLGPLGSVSAAHLMIAVGVLIVVGALGSRLVGVGRRESQSGL